MQHAPILLMTGAGIPPISRRPALTLSLHFSKVESIPIERKIPWTRDRAELGTRCRMAASTVSSCQPRPECRAGTGAERLTRLVTDVKLVSGVFGGRLATSEFGNDLVDHLDSFHLGCSRLKGRDNVEAMHRQLCARGKAA